MKQIFWAVEPYRELPRGKSQHPEIRKQGGETPSSSPTLGNWRPSWWLMMALVTPSRCRLPTTLFSRSALASLARITPVFFMSWAGGRRAQGSAAAFLPPHLLGFPSPRQPRNLPVKPQPFPRKPCSPLSIQSMRGPVMSKPARVVFPLLLNSLSYFFQVVTA